MTANLIPGGKSLSGDGSHSPTIRVRVSEQMHGELLALAAERGVGVSKLVRQILSDAIVELRAP